jgi:hypothetical protein
MPKALDTTTPYPLEGKGAAEVLIELVIEADGTVRAARVLDGQSPFTVAVLEATRHWRFTPAKRGGKAIISRIRFLVHFEPETLQNLSVPTAKNNTGTEIPPSVRLTNPSPVDKSVRSDGKMTQKPLEVTIVGQRPEVAVASMGRTDVEQMPGAFGDPFRAIESLPGVIPIVSGMPFFFIRGAPPGNQGYYLDGVRVPLLFHLGMGVGVIHPALVDRVDLYSGGYPAKYGRFAGAIVAADSKDPIPEYHAQGSIRLVDSGAYVTAPLNHGVIALGGRYSYTAAMLSLFAPEIELRYWDYQGKATYGITGKDTISVFAFGALDLLRSKKGNDVGDAIGTEFHRIDLRYNRRISECSRAFSAITVGYDKTLAGDVVAVRDRIVHTRTVFEHALSTKNTWRIGADGGLDDYGTIVPVPRGDNVQLIRSLPKRMDTVLGLWTDVSWFFMPRVRVVPGVRVDHYSSGTATRLAIEPRVSAVFSLKKSLRIVHAFGIAHQPPSFIVPVPGFQISGLKDGLQRSIQSSAGVEADLPKQISIAGTVFQNAFFNLTDPISAMALNRELDDVAQRSRGHAVGLELSIRRSFSERVGGFITYTLSKSTRTLDGIRFPSAVDRRHVLQTAVAFNLGRGWRASSRVMFYTGIPSTFRQVLDSGEGNSKLVGSRTWVNPEQLPRTAAYFRVDLRLQKRWPVGNRGAYWAFTFEVLNSMLNREMVAQQCNDRSCTGDRIGPITIPSLGVEAAY